MLAGSDPRIVGTIETEQTKVQVFFEKAEKLVDKELRASISEYKKAIPPSKLAEWRKSKPLSNEQLNFAHSMIAGITERHYEQLFPNDPLPNSEDALYWIPFRHSVALQALTLKWIRDDGHLAAKVATLRNDSIDMFYVAYGTIFDGVLSSDSKLLELCVLADTILRYAYGLSRTAP